jgi:tetratricopeptide (TPR) repeat protein
MEEHFSPEKIPEFLYHEKENQQRHSIVYTEAFLADKLKKIYTTWFSASDISPFAGYASDAELKLILFALVPDKENDYENLFETLCSLVHAKGKQTENPCFFINEKAPGLLMGSSESENSEKTASDILDKFEAETGHQAICGISYYPCLDYTHTDIIQNGFKALIHASMLENKKLAVFDSVSLNISSDEYFQKKDIDNAVKELEKGLLLNEKDENILNSLGVCFAVKKDFDKSLKYFEMADQHSDAGFIMPLYNKGLINYLNNDTEKAKTIFLQAFEKCKDFYEIPFYLGKTEYDLKNTEKALEYFLKAEKIKPESAAVLNYIGEIYLKNKDIEKAYTEYKKSLKIMPENPYALSAIGYIYFIKGENTEIAKTFMEQSLEMDPENKLFKERLNLLVSDENKEDLKKAQSF